MAGRTISYRFIVEALPELKLYVAVRAAVLINRHLFVSSFIPEEVLFLPLSFAPLSLVLLGLVLLRLVPPLCSLAL